MSNTSDHSRAQQRVLARRLGAIALALFVVFTASVLARIIPFRVLLASWQLEFAASLIDAAPIALLGLILVSGDSENWPRCDTKSGPPP